MKGLSERGVLDGMWSCYGDLGKKAGEWRKDRHGQGSRKKYIPSDSNQAKAIVFFHVRGKETLDIVYFSTSLHERDGPGDLPNGERGQVERLRPHDPQVRLKVLSLLG